ncbi:MAG: ABC transporter permease [Saprospiraceae bacterium]|nr:ABC transporter permease [Saprospiraceae bacterium]
MVKILPAYQLILAEIGDVSRFTLRFFKEWLKPRFETRELIHQFYMIGYRSVGLVAITGFILGLVMTIQSRPTMAQFGAEAWIPAMVAISIIREIGPVVTALICAGKIGSGIGAELGSMKVTEQIDAMEVSGTNPFKYLVVTRVLATTLMVPILVCFSAGVAIFGSFLAVNIKGVTSLALFYQQVVDSLAFSDVLPAFIKTFFFGFAIGIIGCYKGYTSNKGTEGVGLAANSAVVIASLLVFVIDLLAVQVTDILGYN